MARTTQIPPTTLDDDLKMLTDELEAVLKSSGDMADEKYQEIKASAEQALSRVRRRLNTDGVQCCARLQKAADDAERCIRINPWQSVGVAAAAGLILGLILRR